MTHELISHADIAIRLILATGLALLLGIEREKKQQPAGIRTHILIALGACVFTILSIDLPIYYNATNLDPARIAAQIVSGIGFIGAGAIMRNGMTTKGLTTAANIWTTAAIGMAVGAGFYFLSIVATAMMLMALIFFSVAKQWFLPQTRYCSIKISIVKKDEHSREDIKKILLKMPIEIVSIALSDSSKNRSLQVMVRMDWSVSVFALEKHIKKHIPEGHVTISENTSI